MRKEYRKPVVIILAVVLSLTMLRFLYRFVYQGKEYVPEEIRIILAPILISYIGYSFYRMTSDYLTKRSLIEKDSADKLNRSEDLLRIAQKIANIGYWEEFLISGEINFTDELCGILEIESKENNNYKKEQLALLHSADKNDFHLRQDELFNYGQIEFEYKTTTPKGNTKYFFERVTLVKKDGAPHKFVGVIQDISERMLDGQKILQSERYYKSLFDGAKDAIILFYPSTGIVIDVNQQACRMYGFTKDEFIGKSLMELIKDKESGIERINNLVADKQNNFFKSTHYKSDGTELYLEITASIFDYYGVEVVLSINRDVTGSRIAEERIRLLSLGIEQHPSPIVITDTNAAIEYVNHSFEEITGYSFEEVKGKNPRILQSGETPKEVYDDLWKTLADKKEWRGEFKNKRKDGSFYWEMAVIYPMVDSDNIVRKYFANKTDITERKELEFQLKLYRERLEFLVDERTKRLKESEETFRALSENSNDVIMRFNRNVEHIYVNPAAQRLFNLPSFELLGKNYSKLNFTDEAYLKWDEAIRKVFDTRIENTIELQVPDGKWFDCRLYPEFDNEEEIVSVITSSREITKSKMIENDLYNKERLLRGVAEASNKLLSLDSFFNRINKALEIIGKAAEIDRVYIFENSRDEKHKDLLMSQLYEWAASGITPQINNPKFQKLSYKKAGVSAALETLSNGQPYSILVKDIPLPAREKFEIQQVQSMLIMPIEIGGIFWGFVGFDECKFQKIWDESEVSILKILASDIGGAFTRKLIEDALMNTEERFKALFDFAPIAYFIVDPSGSFIDVNNSFENTIGLTKKEIAEMERIQNLVISKEEKVSLDKVLAHNLSGKSPGPIEITLFHKRGKKLILELNTFPITLAEKNMVLCAVHDVSLRKETENEIRTALTHSQELNEIKSRFVSMVSHEFRTPLSTILSSVEILKLFESRLKEEEKENHFRKISKSIDYLTNLLDDVITINRADSGRLIVKFKNVDVVPLLEQWILDIKASYTETPEIIFSKTFESMKVELDENQLRQIVSNLLNNAIKYTPSNKKITISVSGTEKDFILQIADEGIGIPADAQKDLFSPFFRAINTGNVPGSGLGLAVAKRSIESLKGKISYESKENEGTTFTVIIPLKRGKDEKNSTD